MNKADSNEQDPTVDELDEDTETTIGASKTTLEIRDIILGPTIRQHNKRFRAIDRELERSRQLSEERHTELETKLNQKYEELHSEIHKSLRDIDKQLNERIDQISNKGEIDHRKLSTLIDTLGQELQEKVDKMSSTQSNEIGEVRDQMRRNYDTLRSELVGETDDLDERKLDRFTIAESLIELGMKLKDENLLDELNTQLADEG